MSADRPILFSAPMVRALLDGRKTQTRRLAWRTIKRRKGECGFSPPTIWQKVKPGDLLWVRETWKPHSIYAHLKPREIPQSKVFFRADDAYAPSNTRWIPGIHMPRWASRITLEVTDVRVERLKEISHDDAVAEGCYRIEPCAEYPHGNAWGRAGYAALWDQLHGQGSWESNPEVVALAFIVHKSNIDAMPKREAA